MLMNRLKGYYSLNLLKVEIIQAQFIMFTLHTHSFSPLQMTKFQFFTKVSKIVKFVNIVSTLGLRMAKCMVMTTLQSLMFGLVVLEIP